MINSKAMRVGVLVIILTSASVLLSGQKIELGKFTLPRDVEYSGKTLLKGEYQLSLETREEGSFIGIWKNGELLSEEMAIIQDVKKEYPQPVIAVDVITQDKDQFVRISVFMGKKVYKAFYKCL